MAAVVRRLPSRDEVQTERARRHLHTFVRHAWSIIEPTTPFIDNWHIGAVCEALTAVSLAQIGKLIINIPPGTAKSLLSAVFWPAWEMVDNPALRFLFWSFDDGLTIRDSARTHDLVVSEWYQARWPHVHYKHGENAKIRRATTAGGWRIASSFGGVGTGEHPDRVGVDDPHNPRQAESDAQRTEAIKRFDSTLTTRGASRNARFVVTMQRLHQADLTGHLLQRADADQWTLLCLPMRYEAPVFVDLQRTPDEAPRKVPAIPGTQTPMLARRADVDPRTTPGELLWPALFTEAVVRTLEAGLGSYGAAGQLAQRPAPAEGGLFKREWFAIVEAVPATRQRCRGWDKAGSDAAGDWTAGVLMSKDGDGIYYIEDVKRDRLSSGKRNKLMKQTAQLDGVATVIRIEQEGGSGGKESAEISVKEFPGYTVVVKPSTVDKVARARPLAIQAEAGNVRLLRGPWNAAFLDELANFPNGTHDDQVDGASSAFNELAIGQPDHGGGMVPIAGWDE